MADCAYLQNFRRDVAIMQRENISTVRRYYKNAIKELYTRCLHAAKSGQQELVHIYTRVPVEIEGLNSIRKIRKYINKKLNVPCRAVKLDGHEVGIIIKLSSCM